MSEERDPALDKAWRAQSREEPPAALDQAILAAAHRAVDSGPRKAGAEATRPQRWWMPLAAAAFVGAIALGIVQLAPQEPPLDTRAPSTVAPPPAPQRAAQEEKAAKPAPAEAMREADLLQKKQKTSEQAAPPTNAPKPAAPAPLARDNKLGADKLPEPFPAAPMTQKTEAAGGGKAGHLEEKRDAGFADNAARPAPPPAPPAAAAEPMADARKDMRSNERQLAASAPAPAAAPVPAQAPASTSVTARMREGARAQGESGAAAGMVAGTAKNVAAEDEARAKARDPDAWIVRIRKLRDEGHMADALRELREFRELVPDAERRLPADLRDLPR